MIRHFAKQANVELGRRVRSWKAAYLKEVDNREDVEKDLEDFCQVLAYRDDKVFRDSGTKARATTQVARVTFLRVRSKVTPYSRPLEELQRPWLW